MKIRFYVLTLLVLALCSGCTGPKRASQVPVRFTSFTDFKLGPAGGVDLVWSTKSIRDEQSLKMVLQKYDSLILDQTWVAADREALRKLNDQQILGISSAMVNAIQARLGQGFKLVQAPTENTLLLSIALTDLETHAPILAATSLRLPVSPGRFGVSMVAAAEPANIGSVTVELLVSDATTNQPLVAAIDKRFSNKDLAMTISSPTGTQKAIAMWAERLWTTLAYWNWIKERTPAS
ncbi:MAG: DUF3313 domain-containing protein [Desulfuromonadales bacterium]|nr:DUF3313 domain-containing protein [Desulfuromonadales bacterium]